MEWVQLLEEPQPVAAPPGVVYSTRPLHARASDGQTYVLKGPATEVVFPEAVCYQLASLVGLSVPECRLCSHPGQGSVFFASKEVRTRSEIEIFIKDRKVVNPELLPHTVAFDVWVANEDRNLGNIVGEPYSTNGTGVVKLYAIDFEKSAPLRGVNRFTVTALAAKKFWPTGQLGEICRGYELPVDFCKQIAAVQRSAIDSVIQRTIWDLNMAAVPWADSAVDVLEHRAQNIFTLIREVWHG